MNIILVRRKSGAALDINLSRSFIVIFSLLLLGLPVLSYYLGVISSDRTPVMADINKPEHLEPIREELNKIIGSIYKDELARQQEELDALKQHNQENINVLTNNIAKLQAHIFRLDSLGKRLTEVAQLDKKAFNFDFSPSMGGPDDDIAQSNEHWNSAFSDNINYSEFVKRMNQIAQDIDSRSKQLTILEKLLIADQYKLMTTPAGNPAEKGWISSYFGLRKDPFNGKQKMHNGIDFAGKSGTNVLATADGVVISARKQNGYGKVLEIDHGYGLSTRYAHNKTIAVKVGDVVKQGQVIASMGSSGRSTGPHVHYEVLRNGKNVNPKKYIITARK